MPEMPDMPRFLDRSLATSFGPATPDEQIVFGAQMPGYGARSMPLGVVSRWVAFMKAHGIRRVCCLIAQSQLAYYLGDPLSVYREAFGEACVCWAPIPDYCLASPANLQKALRFLQDADEAGEPTVVHCAGGRGRTGHVLAAWLVVARGFSVEEALRAVKDTGRNPTEAVEAGNATMGELYALLETFRTPGEVTTSS